MTEPASEMEKELAAVRIKYNGQCPYEKGHSKEGVTFITGLFLGLLVAIAINGIQYSIWEGWALKNGYASYNTNGYIMWVKP